jgi:serine protease Do
MSLPTITLSPMQFSFVIASVNGKKIRDSRDLARHVARLAPNSNIPLVYLRGGKEETAQVTIGQLKDTTALKRTDPPQPGKSQTSRLGIDVAPAARVMGIGEQGLAVLRVDPAGKAAEAGLRPADIILQLGGVDASSADDLVRALEQAANQNKQHVLAFVRRNDRGMFITLPAEAG